MTTFIESADSRQTSIEIMNAILWLAGWKDDNALQIWMDPSYEELLSIWERVKKNGLLDSSDFFWGTAGGNWAADIEKK